MPLPLRITLVKEFNYRGAAEEWSNTYGFTGPALADYSAMVTFVNQIAFFEKTLYVSTCKVVRALIYQPGSIVADRTLDFAAEVGGQTPGTLILTAGTPEWAGDQAGWIRGKIGVNSKGRPVYVRKYYHAGTSPVEDTDQVSGNWGAAANAYLNTITGGGLQDGRRWCGPNGQNVSLTARSTHVTTRTLKRRGRRPTPSP